MAVSTSIFPDERKRFWFSSRVANSTPQTPFAELQRQYWYSLGHNGTFTEQEKKWLRGIITGAGKTPSQNNSINTLLAEALSAQGITPSKYVGENWQLLFIKYNP